jgi:CheY-like chemotaxis protein
MIVPSKKCQPTLLVVDDNEVSSMVMAHNLKNLGCRTILVESGEKALEILESEPSVDLVITDVKMAGMDGLELLLRIKQSKVLSDLPVIVCTGSDEAETVTRAMELGCVQYLVKPVHPELLLEHVGMVLKKQMPVLEDAGVTQDRCK